MITYTHLTIDGAKKYRSSLCKVTGTLTGVGEHDQESLVQTIQKMFDQGTMMIIAKDDEIDEVVGSVTLVCERVIQRSGAIVGHLEMLIVRKERQGQGIGSQLLKRVIELAKQQGCYKIIGQSVQALAPYYQKFGFDTKEIGLKMYLE